MQTIIIAGNIGKDAITKDVNGNSVTEWSVGVSAGRNSDTTWYKCSYWGTRGAKVAGYIRKGEKITVSGSLTAGVYDGKPDMKVNVSDVTLQGGKAGGRSDGPGDDYAEPARGGRGGSGYTDDLNDDVPF
jgi:single-strand DNA-binding protein